MRQRATVMCFVAMLAMLTLLAGLTGCMAVATAPPPSPPPSPSPGVAPTTKGIDLGSLVADSAYLPVERTAAPPDGYALYTVLLTRSVNAASVQALARVLAVTVDAREAAIERRNLNLIVLPVKQAAAATRVLASARTQPDGTAATLLQQHYDFGQAALLLSALCRPERGADVMKLCGPGQSDGPILVSGLRPLRAQSPAGERLLVVNLSMTSPAAMGEAIAAFRRQVMRKDYDGPDSYEYWRLWVLDKALVAAKLLPGVGKAYAGTP
jgi:hypothetical protein